MERHPPYRRITRRGVDLDWRTWAAVLETEHRLRRRLVLAQGSYNSGGVAASAGTHDGGGAVDVSVAGLADADVLRTVRTMRRVGWAAWHREAIAGLWPEHIHAVLLDHQTASAGAKSQMAEYRLGGDGLVGALPDPMPYRPDPIPVFDYAAWQTRRILAHRIADLLGRVDNLRRRRSVLDVTH